MFRLHCEVQDGPTLVIPCIGAACATAPALQKDSALIIPLIQWPPSTVSFVLEDAPPSRRDGMEGECYFGHNDSLGGRKLKMALSMHCTIPPLMVGRAAGTRVGNFPEMISCGIIVATAHDE